MIIKIAKERISFVRLLVKKRTKIYRWSLISGDEIQKKNFGDVLNCDVDEILFISRLNNDVK